MLLGAFLTFVLFSKKILNTFLSSFFFAAHLGFGPRRIEILSSLANHGRNSAAAILTDRRQRENKCGRFRKKTFKISKLFQKK